MIIDHKQINLSYPAMVTVEQITNRDDLVFRLREAAKGAAGDPLSTYLVERFRVETQEQLRNAPDGVPATQALSSAVVDELNRLVQGGDSFFSPDRFAGVALGADTQALLAKAAVGENLILLNRLLLRDGFLGLVADIPKIEPRWFPDYRAHFQKKFAELVKQKSYAAKPLHRGVVVGNQILAELFDDPEGLVRVLATSDLIDIEHPRSSRFFDALEFSGPMYKIFTEEEKTIILDWIESLRKRDEPDQPEPGPSPQEAATKILTLISSHAAVAGNVRRHGQFQIAGRSLKDWFSDPRGLMAAFASSPDWVVPGNSAASRLYTEFATGLMRFMGSTRAEDIRRWIDTGAVLVDPNTVPLEGAISLAAVSLRQHSATFTETAETAVAAAPVAVASPEPLIRRDFAAKRKLIGMGSVH